MKNTKKGFTLVELLVVIAILAILASVAVVGYTAFLDKANESNRDTEAYQIKTAITSALVIPGEVYEITEDVTVEIDEDGAYLVTGLNSALDLEPLTSDACDFAGLKGTLSIAKVDGEDCLVYTPDSGVGAAVVLAGVVTP